MLRVPRRRLVAARSLASSPGAPVSLSYLPEPLSANVTGWARAAGAISTEGFTTLSAAQPERTGPEPTPKG